MKEKPTLEYIWNRVKEETKPSNCLPIYRKVAELKGYSLDEANLYLTTIFPKLNKYGGETNVPLQDASNAPGHTTIDKSITNALGIFFSGEGTEDV